MGRARRYGRPVLSFVATLTPTQIRALAASVLPGASAGTLDIAVAIAMAESRGRTDAISPTNDYGIWQINAPSWPQFSKAQLLDPVGNARAMAHISKGGTNWNPWVTFGSKYRDFMPGGAQAAAHGISNIRVPGTNFDIDLTPGFDFDPTPGFDLPNPMDVATDWVEPLVSRAAVAVLAMVFTSFGLTLFAFGLFRLTASSKTATDTVKTIGAASTGVGAVAALA